MLIGQAEMMCVALESGIKTSACVLKEAVVPRGTQDQVGKTKVPSARYKFLPATQEAGSALSLQVDANPASQRHPSASTLSMAFPGLAFDVS